MAAEKTVYLSVNLPESLQQELERTALTERISIDELVRDAVERRLRKSEWEDLLAFGQRHAKERGLTEADIPEAIAEVRREGAKRER